jgi:hypothetical protein
MNENLKPIDHQQIQSRICTLRGVQVMIDRDLAELYQVETKVLNQAVKRNVERFPELFRFQLNQDEKNELVTTCDRFKILKHSTALPHAFSEQGVSMLSAVLRSDTAIQISIQIVNAFVSMRKFLANNVAIFQRLDNIEQKQFVTDGKLLEVFKALEAKDIKPKQGIFFDGQIFVAYVFVADLIKSANNSIILIDSYVDETVLTLLAKRKKNATATIYTRSISKQLQLDLKKHNQQYPAIEVKILHQSHDRFMILDDKTVFHIGASLKDLGKKWFAFSEMDKGGLELIGRLGNE